ncbi:MAG: NlpC/P60 family protein [Spirosomataceae bacterium]
MKKVLLFLFISVSLLAQAQRPSIGAIIEQVKKKYAPDKRVAVFQVDVDSVRLVGKTNIAAAKKELLNRLRSNGYDLFDAVRVLPEAEIGDKIYAAVNISVANIRKEPREAAELTTQALLGTSLKVLEKEKYWYLVQSPDGYIGWVESMTIQRFDKAEAEKYDKALKVIYTKPYGFAYADSSDNAATVSDLTWGGLLVLNQILGEYYEVIYPDNRKAYIPKKEAVLYDDWLKKVNPTQESLVKSAQKMTGLPYLWGGTSWKGVDCSGYTRMIYQMNGILLPRDASQQVHSGDLIDTSNEFEKLQVGDLLFFGEKATPEKPERIVHVGMWIGECKFIHSSGMVRVGSFDKDSPIFDAYNLGRFIKAKRILGSENGVIHLKKANGI